MVLSGKTQFFGWCVGWILLGGAVFAKEPDLARARQVFHQEIAQAYGVESSAVTVQPQYPGLPDNPYDDLRIGDFFAFRADWKGQDPGPRGFAASDGRVIFAQGNRGVWELLRECQVFGPQPLPLLKIVERLAWVYRAAGTPTEGLHRQHRFERDGDRVSIVWYGRAGDRTGAFSLTEVTVKADRQGGCTVKFDRSFSAMP